MRLVLVAPLLPAPNSILRLYSESLFIVPSSPGSRINEQSAEFNKYSDVTRGALARD